MQRSARRGDGRRRRAGAKRRRGRRGKCGSSAITATYDRALALPDDNANQRRALVIRAVIVRPASPTHPRARVAPGAGAAGTRRGKRTAPSPVTPTPPHRGLAPKESGGALARAIGRESRIASARAAVKDLRAASRHSDRSACWPRGAPFGRVPDCRPRCGWEASREARTARLPSMIPRSLPTESRPFSSHACAFFKELLSEKRAALESRSLSPLLFRNGSGERKKRPARDRAEHAETDAQIAEKSRPGFSAFGRKTRLVDGP